MLESIISESKTIAQSQNLDRTEAEVKNAFCFAPHSFLRLLFKIQPRATCLLVGLTKVGQALPYQSIIKKMPPLPFLQNGQSLGDFSQLRFPVSHMNNVYVKLTKINQHNRTHFYLTHK